MSILGVLSSPTQLFVTNSEGNDIPLVIENVFVIKNLVHKFILGAPFLFQHGLLVDLARNRLLCIPRNSENVTNIFPAKLTHSLSASINSIYESSLTSPTSLPSGATIDLPLLQSNVLIASKIKPSPAFSLYNFELNAGDRCKDPCLS